MAVKQPRPTHILYTISVPNVVTIGCHLTSFFYVYIYIFRYFWRECVPMLKYSDIYESL